MKDLKKAKRKFKYEPFGLKYNIEATYYPDIVFKSDSGTEIIVELKGWFRPEDKRKMKSVKICYPRADIRIVFQAKNDKNIRWCEKHGFKWAIGTIDLEWFKE